MDNMNVPPAPATVVIIGPQAYSVNGVALADTAGLFQALQVQRAERIEVRIAPGTDTDYERVGKLIFALSRNGWNSESPDSMHWALEAAGPASTAH
ncbi:hypothetical protein INH39_27265 [Massilia violaceinigra]|uniref:Uncharacterized protein n=1 Tax=Massilia violaceinigra TaxID=2045208 RepID=A0ABY4A6A3_9BURK|nr:hypothetical protein [Massilia violaceinigra]UOD29081.1 hypothetical protein INH39_27265 [Massilia violaceinigra]